MKTEKILVMTSGERVSVTGESGKYWLTKDSQYRKLSPQIQAIEEVEICEPEPKKKPSSRKKKKPDEDTPKEGK